MRERPVPAALAALLRRAHAAERAATGAARVPAFRLTRTLLGGARALGYPTRALADCLELAASSVGSRVGADGWVDVDDFAELAGLRPATVRGWARRGRLPTASAPAPARSSAPDGYLASDLIRALTRRG